MQGLKTPCLHPQIVLTLHRTRTMTYTYSICISSKTRKLAIVDGMVFKGKKKIIFPKFP